MHIFHQCVNIKMLEHITVVGEMLGRVDMKTMNIDAFKNADFDLRSASRWDALHNPLSFVFHISSTW